MNDTALLIPHYNNPKGLIASIASIDSSEEIDIVVVDDGSILKKINEKLIMDAFTANGSIFYIYLEQNKGIEHALNIGLDFILAKKYLYTARLDAGDICINRRFKIQKEFLKQNPNIKLIGTNVMATDTEGNFIYNIILPEKHKDIKQKMYLNSMFIHPSVMFVNEIIKTIGNYPTNYKAAEDYAFFFKIAKQFETSNLQEPLLKYEINPDGISLSKRKQQMRSRLKVIWDNFYIGFYPIYGLLRNTILYFIPNNLIQIVKKIKK